MVYVIADLHGYPLVKLIELLKKADFGGRHNDILFILGDVIDRGTPYGGIDILKWLLFQPNVQLLLGNHEAMLLSCEWIFNTITDESLENITSANMDLLSGWIANGADPTLTALKQLLRAEPCTVSDIIEYLKECPLYETVSVANRDYILTHSGLGHFSPTKKLSDYSAEELLWTRPRLEDKYYNNATVVFGHTPTEYWGEQNKGKIIRTESWIAIDTGEMPTLLRLDDMAEFKL